MTEVEVLLYNAGNIVLYAAWLAILALVAYYWRVARWWTSPEGRMIQAWNVWPLIAMTYLSVRTIWGPPQVIDVWGLVFRIFVLATGLCLFVWRLVLIAEAQSPRHTGGPTKE